MTLGIAVIFRRTGGRGWAHHRLVSLIAGVIWVAASGALLSACQLAPPAAEDAGPLPPQQASQPESELVVSLVRLGNDALASGDVGIAESRYRRALSFDPRSRRARMGLIEVFLESGRWEEAGVFMAEVLASARDEERVDALILHASIEHASGRSAEARDALSSALVLDDARYNAHARLAEWTGPAPHAPARDADEAFRQALEHPYDPAALVAGARVRVARGDEEGAVEWLENAVWLADLDLDASRRAIALLTQIDKDWKRRSVVWVHVYADESVRREAGWKMRLRLAWRSASISLDPLIHVAFVPVTVERFRAAHSRSDLPSISAAFHAGVARLPSHGLLAVVTERPPPRRRGSHQLGFAQFMGRELTVRLTPGDFLSRTLVHEVLHIYGGVHVAPEIESLMNAAATSDRLDLGNKAIAWLLRNRRFGPGGIDENILPYVELDELISGFVEMLRVNLGLRRKGMKDARTQTSRYVAAEMSRRAVELDPHLGDVAKTTGSLMVKSGDLPEAASLYATAARLYGLDSPNGKKMQELARTLDQLSATGNR